MPDANQQRHCLWCNAKFPFTYRNRMLCSQKCHCDFHRHRAKYFSHLTPREFKHLIIDWLSLDVPDHPNKNHPAHKLNEEVAEMWRQATQALKLIGELTDAQ